MFITQAWNISQLDAVYRTSTKSREIGWRSERNRLNRLITRTSDSIECIVDRCSRLQRLQGSACSADADLAFLGGALFVESMGGGHRDLIQSLSAQIPRAQSCSNYMDKTWENSFNMCQSTWLPMVTYTSEGLFPAHRSSNYYNYYTRNPLLQLISLSHLQHLAPSHANHDTFHTVRNALEHQRKGDWKLVGDMWSNFEAIIVGSTLQTFRSPTREQGSDDKNEFLYRSFRQGTFVRSSVWESAQPWVICTPLPSSSVSLATSAFMFAVCRLKSWQRINRSKKAEWNCDHLQ